jgi:cell division septum initiation protein DivIVA
VIERIKAVIAEDPKLRQRVDELRKELNMGQEQA